MIPMPLVPPVTIMFFDSRFQRVGLAWAINRSERRIKPVTNNEVTTTFI